MKYPRKTTFPSFRQHRLALKKYKDYWQKKEQELEARTGGIK